GAGYTLAASSNGLPAETSGPFDVVASPAVALEFIAQPGDAIANAAITPAIRVHAVDASGNPATDFAGLVTIGLGANPSGATLGGTLTMAAAAGVATFADLVIDRAG